MEIYYHTYFWRVYQCLELLLHVCLPDFGTIASIHIKANNFILANSMPPNYKKLWSFFTQTDCWIVGHGLRLNVNWNSIVGADRSTVEFALPTISCKTSTIVVPALERFVCLPHLQRACCDLKNNASYKKFSLLIYYWIPASEKCSCTFRSKFKTSLQLVFIKLKQKDTTSRHF